MPRGGERKALPVPELCTGRAEVELEHEGSSKFSGVMIRMGTKFAR